MKCLQKSCQRNKNINFKTGLCNVCEEVVQDTTNKLIKKDQTKILIKKVDVDYKEMVKMQDKLSKGEINDPAIVNGLILGGIINILVQHDAMEELDAKMKALEEENKTNKNRIESLETWNCKQTEEIQKLANQIETLDKNGVIVKENNEFNHLKKKITNLEIEMLGLKPLNRYKSQQDENGTRLTSENPLKKARKTCDLCENTFVKNCDLELHMKEVHEIDKNYKCDECDKDFFLEWRRNKHMKIHTDDAKYCHFYNNRKQCPYDELGCMFLHIRAEQCTFQHCSNKLCQFRHDNQIETIDACEEMVVNDRSDVEEEPIKENQCHLCMNQMDSKDNLMSHMERNHEEYFNGMMEVAAMMSSK